MAAEPAPKRRWTRVPAPWEPNAAHRRLAAENGVDFDVELAKFRDHEFAKPKSDADAAFRNWIRSATRRGPAPGALEHRRNGGVVDIDPPARTVIRPTKRDGLPMAEIGQLAASFLGGRR